MPAMDVRGLDPNQLRALKRFFQSYFYADSLETPSDLGAALKDYEDSESGVDPEGRMLLAGVEGIIAIGLAEDELVQLIEHTWRSAGISSYFGYRYNAVLRQMRAYLLGDVNWRHATS